ncbi:MAG: hypothetical protein U7123_05100 [Potamolinea sp.]
MSVVICWLCRGVAFAPKYLGITDHLTIAFATPFLSVISASDYQLPITNYQLPITNYQLPITCFERDFD